MERLTSTEQRDDDAERVAMNAEGVAWDSLGGEVKFQEAAEVVAPEHLVLDTDIIDDGEVIQPRQELSEAERRQAADRESIDAVLRMLGRAANEQGLSAEDVRKINLSLDVMDEASEQLDGEENTLSAREILNGLGQKYERLFKKAPTEERRHKYHDMAAYAYQQMKRQADWQAMDARKVAPRPGSAQETFDKLSEIV